MNNVFTFSKREREIVIGDKAYVMKCNEEVGGEIDKAAIEAKKLASELREGVATTNDIKAVYEIAFVAALGEDAVNEILHDHDMDVYDYDDLARFLLAQFNAYHEERVKKSSK